jgi:PAS domain S-box-containing protein
MMGAGSEESLVELYEEAPCGYVVTAPDGAILRVNRTLLDWSGYTAADLAAGKRFHALLTVPGALLYETHCVPLLRLRGYVGEIALDLVCQDGKLLPVLLSIGLKKDGHGAPATLRIVIFNAPRRREYERELLAARLQAEEAAEQVRVHRELAERKLAEQELLLQAVARMAAGNLEAPVPMQPDSSLAPLAHGLDRMRQDFLRQIRELEERNAEIQELNRELRRQIEQRSSVFADTMMALGGDSPAELQALFGSGMVLAGRYRVDSLLGQGAMGTVYRVERLSDGRPLAAKVLNIKPDYRAMARFAREAQLLARLHHPNLIDIVDIDVTKERVAYIVMELAPGQSLAELSARYGEVGFMLPVLHQILDALVAVHAAGIVHRDVKPGNVLIALDGDGTRATAKLVDFGVSRLLDTAQDSDPAYLARASELSEPPALPTAGLSVTQDGPRLPAASASQKEAELDDRLTVDGRTRSTDLARALTELAPPLQRLDSPAQKGRSTPAPDLTQAGALLGTPLYMAPELAGGARGARLPSDIFSFGVMAYEVLTGSLPFSQPPPLLGMYGNGELPFEPLDRRCPSLPSATVRALEACLAFNPLHRPTASELLLTLGDCLLQRRSRPSSRSGGSF